jgi:hypothetical protein
VNGEPSELTWALLKRYPVAVSCIGDPDVLNPRGSGYYAVIKMDLAPHSTLYRDLQIRSVIPCKEQLLNRYASEMVEAWPLDALTIAPSATALGPNQLRSIPEGVYQRNGLWARVDDEVADTADMEAEEFSESGSVSYRGR